MHQFHSCSHNGLDVECWGRNDFLQSDVPADIGVPVEVAVGGLHSCLLQTDQQVRCWGSNDNAPTTVPGNLGNVTRVAVGYYHSCALNDAGAVSCWGSNNFGQLKVPAGMLPATRIYSGPYNVCADSLEGVVCWGRNDYGQSAIWYDLKGYGVGDDHVCGINNRIAIPRFNLVNPAAITVGGQYPNTSTTGHSCVADDNGVQCWGASAKGVLNVPASLTNVVGLHAGWGVSCALQVDGTVSCWGGYISAQSTQMINIGAVSRIEGYHEKVCARGARELKCTLGGGALLLD